MILSIILTLLHLGTIFGLFYLSYVNMINRNTNEAWLCALFLGVIFGCMGMFMFMTVPTTLLYVSIISHTNLFIWLALMVWSYMGYNKYKIDKHLFWISITLLMLFIPMVGYLYYEAFNNSQLVHVVDTYIMEYVK